MRFANTCADPAEPCITVMIQFNHTAGHFATVASAFKVSLERTIRASSRNSFMPRALEWSKESKSSRICVGMKAAKQSIANWKSYVRAAAQTRR